MFHPAHHHRHHEQHQTITILYCPTILLRKMIVYNLQKLIGCRMDERSKEKGRVMMRIIIIKMRGEETTFL